MSRAIRNQEAYDKSRQEVQRLHNKAVTRTLKNLLAIIAKEPEYVLHASNKLLLIDDLIQSGVLGAESDVERQVARDRKRAPLCLQTSPRAVEFLLERNSEWFALVDEVLSVALNQGSIVLEVDQHGEVSISIPLSATDSPEPVEAVDEQILLECVLVEVVYDPIDRLTDKQLKALGGESKMYK